MIDLDYTAGRFWMDAGQISTSLILWVYVMVSNRKKVAKKRFETIDKRFDSVETSMKESLQFAIDNHAKDIDERCKGRLERIEALERDERLLELQLVKLPTHKDLQDLSRQLNGVQSGMSKLSGRLEGINRVADLMNEFLINQGGKKEAPNDLRGIETV